MVTKVYRAYFLKSLSIDLPDGRTIAFQGGIYADSTAKFTTDNPAIQEQLEASRGFNDTFYLEAAWNDGPETVGADNDNPADENVSSQEQEPEKEPLTDVKDVKRFHNIVEMRAAMAELGFEGVQEMNYSQLCSAASQKGYDFKIQR